MIATLTCAEEATVGLDTDVNQLRRGDLDALSALVARYQNRLYRYLLRLVRNSADADDLFQQTWIRVAEQIRRYDPNRNFDAWLFTLARHLAIDFLRRRHPESLDKPPAGDPNGATMAANLAAKEPPPTQNWKTLIKMQCFRTDSQPLHLVQLRFDEVAFEKQECAPLAECLEQAEQSPALRDSEDDSPGRSRRQSPGCT